MGSVGGFSGSPTRAGKGVRDSREPQTRPLAPSPDGWSGPQPALSITGTSRQPEVGGAADPVTATVCRGAVFVAGKEDTRGRVGGFAAAVGITGYPAPHVCFSIALTHPIPTRKIVVHTGTMCMCIHTYAHTYVCTCIHTYVCTSICVRAYTCMYTDGVLS